MYEKIGEFDPVLLNHWPHTNRFVHSRMRPDVVKPRHFQFFT